MRLTEAQRKALLEAVKEPIRLLLLAVIPFGITMLADINAWWAIAGTVLLRAFDRYLHITGKQEAGRSGKGQSFGIVKL